jgi:hypothetical protein
MHGRCAVLTAQPKGMERMIMAREDNRLYKEAELY